MNNKNQKVCKTEFSIIEKEMMCSVCIAVIRRNK